MQTTLPPDRLQIAPKPHSLPVFFSLAILLSWAAWAPAALASHGYLRLGLDPTITDIIGVFGPFWATILTTAIFDGRAGFRSLWQRLWTLRVGGTWYLFVLFWPAVRSLLNTLLAVLFGAPWPDFASPPILTLYPFPPDLPPLNPLVILPFVFLQQTLLGSSLGEEPGWRGYVLPRLQTLRLSFPLETNWATRITPALSASLLLGLFGGLWHLPLWLTKGHPVAEHFLGWTMLGLLADTILYTWVFNHTRGSLFLALLFHTSIAITNLFVAASPTHPLVGVALSWVAAALVIWKGRLDGP